MYEDEENFAEANAAEQYHLAQLLGMPEEQAIAQGQYAYDASYDEYDAALEEAAQYQAMEEEIAYERSAYEQAAAAYRQEQEKDLRAQKAAEADKKMRLVQMREAEQRRQHAKAQEEELAKMRRDAKYEAMMADLHEFEPQKWQFEPKTEVPPPAQHKQEFKKLMNEYREQKKNSVFVDDGTKRKEVVLTPPEDDVEAPPLETWASSAVCRALDSVELPNFESVGK